MDETFVEKIEQRGSVVIYRLPPGEYLCYDHSKGQYLCNDGEWRETCLNKVFMKSGWFDGEEEVQNLLGWS
jgi:hypothetical protein